jgi:hypothetical protein
MTILLESKVLKLIGKTVRAICYLLSSFFFYFGGMVTFFGVIKSSAVVSQEDFFMIKVFMTVFFSLLAIIFLICALAIDRFGNWKHNIGVVVVSVTCFVLFSIVSIVCLPPDINMLDEALSINYISGLGCMVAFGAVGALLLKVSSKSRSEVSAKTGEVLKVVRPQ